MLSFILSAFLLAAPVTSEPVAEEVNTLLLEEEAATPEEGLLVLEEGVEEAEASEEIEELAQ